MMSIIDFTQLEKVIEKMVSTYTAANSCDRFGDDKHCDICKKCKNVSFYTYSVKKDDMRHKSVCPLLLCESCENTLTNKLMLLYTETIANLIHEFQFHSKDKN